DFLKESSENQGQFWLSQSGLIRWFDQPKRALTTDGDEKEVWFANGKTNLCYLALDKHVEDGYGNAKALVYDSLVYQQKLEYTYSEVLAEVERLAGGLDGLGVQSGDTVLIYMPMIPHAVFSMLACARIGAVHVNLHGGGSVHDLRKYIEYVKPKIIITATSGIENNRIISFKPIVDKAIEKSEFKPQNVIVFNRKLGTYNNVKKYDVDYQELVKKSKPRGCQILPSTHPSSVVFVGDRDSKFRGIVRDTGGYAVSLAYAMKYSYGIAPGDICLTSSNLDTVMGANFSVYAPLIHGCTTIIHEGNRGGAIDPEDVWELISEHGINHFITTPALFRMLKLKDPKGESVAKYKMSGLKNLFFTGERCELELYEYTNNLLPGTTVSNHWFLKEAGVPVAAHSFGLDAEKTTTPDLGYAVPGIRISVISEETQKPVEEADDEGVLVLDRPLPPGFALTFLDNDDLFQREYFTQYPDYFNTSKYGSVNDEGVYHIAGRVDDHFLVSGIMLSAQTVENEIMKHPAVYECAVVGLENGETGNTPIAIIVPKSEYEFYDSIAFEREIQNLVLNELGKIAVPNKVYKVKRLPRTKDGNILREVIRRMLNGKKYSIPSAIINPPAIDELMDKFRRVKIGAFAQGTKPVNDPLKALAERYYNIDSLAKYMDVYRISKNDPIDFWETVANNNFYWRKRWDSVLEWDKKNHKVEWFGGAKLNITDNCIDRHLEDKADQTAIIWEPNNPKDEALHITYRELSVRVNKMANVLKEQGIGKGDRVCIYLPMIPELAVAVLACARIGAVHSVVFAGFSSTALATRINDAQCKMVITSDGAVRGDKTIDLKAIVDEALKEANPVEKVLVVKHLNSEINMVANRDIWLAALLENALNYCQPEVMDAEDMLFILYTSGSTGKPKGIVHTTAGYMVYSAFTFTNVFQYKPGDIYWCTADIGWITGHSYIVYGPLLNGATTVMFEGAPSYPDYGRFWEIVEKHKVTQFYTAPTAIRSLAKQPLDFVEKYDLSSLKILGSVGEPINEEAWHWYNDHIGKKRCPIADTWWQTETGGIMIAPIPFATPTKPTYATLPLPGIFPVLMGEDKTEITSNSVDGHLCIAHPWPGMARTIYGNHQRYVETYFSTYDDKYFTGDGAFRDEVGYFRITGRVDDVIIVSGHNLGTAPIEDAVNEHPAVSESAIVGFPHDVKGNALYGFVILKDEGRNFDNLRKEINQIISDKIGAIAKLDKIQFVPGLPRTRSGKIMRRILRKIASHDTSGFGDTTTLLNPEVIEQISKDSL
ncbi:MAG: acetate--CoA ligase, partial [Capnocytophaga sp.]|nr:acetate--CoA ligase [Capnocytophaga sp.]